MKNELAQKSASALLLTVMIIAILTTTTLASIAVRFDQLASTDKIANSAVAKSAADSALVKVKEKLAAQTPITPKVFNLDDNTESDLSPTTPFRPNPRKIVSTYAKVPSSLPRCSGVIVLVPWTNDGKYLLSQSNESNPALIFHLANIVNDTPLGIIPGNGDLGGNGDDNPEKQKTISQLTNMGHFYNPFAPVGAKQKDLNYWIVKLGGPQDQFLTRKAADGASSFYKNVDFVYLPYLPRWQDSGLFTTASGSKVDRISATDLRLKFESIIKDNNFKVWIDASITDSDLYRYGFGDLFVDSTDYRLKWLQPSLWNDTPEADNFSTPYITENAEPSQTLKWSKQDQPLMTDKEGGWKVAIVKGAQSFSFVKLADNNQTFTAGATITGLVYGSLEGLRLNQSITLLLLNKDQQPLNLQSRQRDPGRLYRVELTKIGSETISNNVKSISLDFQLSSVAYDTPPKADGMAVTGSDLDVIAVLAPPQFSTTKSIDSVKIESPGGNGTEITFSPGSKCLTPCPAVGDLVNLTKATKTPVWGKVTDVDYSDGTELVSFSVDKLRLSPLPTREMAYTSFDDDGKTKIAYYGGSITTNDYDGGYATESDQLWIYDPEEADPSKSWEFKASDDPAGPGRRAGASMVYDSENNRLVMIGGYYHQSIDASGQGDCEEFQALCLNTNWPGLRIAKRVTNDVYVFDLKNAKWKKIDYTFDADKKIQQDGSYLVRLTSSLADRSGLERWEMIAKNPINVPQTLYVDGNPSTITLSPSAAGLAKGDEIYLYGSKLDNSKFYAWGKIDELNYPADSVTVSTYGYKGDQVQVSVKMNSLAIQVVKRQITTTTCTGVVSAVVSGSLYSCLLADTTGYAVGDSVVLEQYDLNNNLSNTLSGFISFINPANSQAYFIADERVTPAGFKDYSVQSAGIVDNDSVIAFPSARYGATFALQPTTPTEAVYWQGTARNINSNHRFTDLWKVEFVKGQDEKSAVWSFQPTDNSIDPDLNDKYNFQVIQPSYSYQIRTTKSAGNKKVVKDKSDLDHRTQKNTTIWDDEKRWLLEIDPNDAGKVVVGAWATLERRLDADGTRETFHGIVEDIYSANNRCGVFVYAENILCLRHNPTYPGDSGLADDSKNVKVTMTPSFRTDIASGGVFKGATDSVTLKNVPSAKLGSVPGVGAMVMIWKDDGNWPTNAYTFIVSGRAYTPNNKTFKFLFDKLTASPHPIGYSTSQIARAGSTDRLVTITDHQMNYYDDTNGPEWIKNTSSGAWKIRLATKNPGLLYRPAPRRGGMMASIYIDEAGSKTSKLFVVGGTFGQYGSLWKEENAGLDKGATLKWLPQYVSPDSTEDIPNLFGGSLVVYKSGRNIKAVYFGGKQKTDLSSADYGRSIGAKMLGRPDNGTMIDGSYYIIDSDVADPTARALTNTIEQNDANWPTGVDKSLKFKGGDRSTKSVCAYLGQVNSSSCSSKSLLSQLGDLGRLDDSAPNDPYNGWTWGKSAILSELGDAFKKQNVGGTVKASLIMSTPTLSGSGVNGRWEQDGYRPYCKDTGAGPCGNWVSQVYGRLGTDFASNKTAALVAYSSINNAEHKGGAILATTVGVGLAIANNRGGTTGTNGGWYSYCAASEIEKDNGEPVLKNKLYQCQSTASRYMSTVPDAEDLLFMLNATQALSAVNTYKVVGYYGGVKRGYLVTSTSGTLPKIYEIVP